MRVSSRLHIPTLARLLRKVILSGILPAPSSSRSSSCIMPLRWKMAGLPCSFKSPAAPPKRLGSGAFSYCSSTFTAFALLSSSNASQLRFRPQSSSSNGEQRNRRLKRRASEGERIELCVLRVPDIFSAAHLFPSWLSLVSFSGGLAG